MIDALKKVESSGGKVTYNAPLLMPCQLMDQYQTAPLGAIFSEHSSAASSINILSIAARQKLNCFLDHETVPSLDRFLSLFNSPELRTLEDLIKFNKRNAELEFPPRKFFATGCCSKFTEITHRCTRPTQIRGRVGGQND